MCTRDAFVTNACIRVASLGDTSIGGACTCNAFIIGIYIEIAGLRNTCIRNTYTCTDSAWMGA